MRLIHYVSLKQVGGVELQFAEFIKRTQAWPGIDNTIMACAGPVHPNILQQLRACAAPLALEKRRFGMKIPHWPRLLRTTHRRLVVRTAAPQAALLWNRLGGHKRAIAEIGPERCIYWDRGSSWENDATRAAHSELQQIPFAIVNSHASKRMLELRWQFAGDIRVCRNALRSSMLPADPVSKEYPQGRRVKLGVAARLTSVKGVNLAVHCLNALRGMGVDAELHIAGTGEERARLERLVGKLSLNNRVYFWGLQRYMQRFYAQVDVFVHLALREPFGAVCVEAMSQGCPVVTTRIDGLPEVVRQGETGFLLSPELSLVDYRALGGTTETLPDQVYDPLVDRVSTPRAVDPSKAASVIAEMLGSPSAYHRQCQAAIEHARNNFCYSSHVDQVLSAVSEFIESMH